MSIDFDAIQEAYGIDKMTDEIKEQIETALDPENMLRMYWFAAVKVLGVNNNLVFTVPEDLPEPKDGLFMFAFNAIGGIATITLIEGKESIEAIEHANNGDPETEHVAVREIRDGEDPRSVDIPPTSTD